MAASTKQSHRPNPAFWLKPVCVAVCSLSMIYCTGHIALGIQHIRADKNWKYPNPDGLLCGLAGAGIGQICCVAYQYLRRQVLLKSSSKKLIQLRKLEYSRSFVQDVLAHVQRVELFLLVPYLSLTWMFSLMPESYYDIESPCNFFHVLVQLLVVDFFTYVFHVGEHTISRWYILTHKAHHKFTNPQLFNAFDATLLDTIFLILFPLYSTAQLCHVNCWSYIVFGFAYSVHFMLIHSEFEHDFDPILKAFYVNTAADHHVHHKLFLFNYGHFFTIYDRIGGTYKCPKSVKGFSMFEDN